LLHLVAALIEAGHEPGVFSLTRGESTEAALRELGVAPMWVGQSQQPAIRTARLLAALTRFRPQIVQSAHFFVNLYVTIAGRVHGALAIGAIRSDLEYEYLTHGRWARPLLIAPPDLITNSWCGRRAAIARGRREHTVHVVPNAISLAQFDAQAGQSVSRAPLGPGPIALAVASLLPVKRLDRFIRALAQARRVCPDLRGRILGDGPERSRLEALAASLGLSAADLDFTGARDDVPAQLAQAAFLVLTSDHEGFPNAILEAMAAGRPVIATPCGDVPELVRSGANGFVVGFDNVDEMATRMVQLATDVELRVLQGTLARRMAERFDRSGLSSELLSTYARISARRAPRRKLEFAG
jgi:glycosyltransferase involved in cell wall biosynthesis